MKKTLVSLMTLALIVLQSGTALPVHAEDATVVDISNDAFSYHCESDYRYAQVYTAGTPDRLTFENTKANYMVTGIYDQEYLDGSKYKVYMVIWIDSYPDYRQDVLRGQMEFDGIEGIDTLQVGDLLYAEDDWGIEPNPFRHHPKASSFEILGNGADILGEEFVDVIQQELRLSWNVGMSGLDLDAVPESIMKRGDVMEDGAVDIMDVIATNKYILGAASLDKMAEMSADINSDHTVDATDSLMILKEVVGLTKDFKET